MYAQVHAWMISCEMLTARGRFGFLRRFVWVSSRSEMGLLSSLLEREREPNPIKDARSSIARGEEAARQAIHTVAQFRSANDAPCGATERGWRETEVTQHAR